MEQVENKFVKSVSIEFEDGSKQVIDGFVMVVTEDFKGQKWGIQLSETFELERLLEFAYDTVDVIEGSRIEDNYIPSKKSHLKLVKG